jgi:hypothetical protein
MERPYQAWHDQKTDIETHGARPYFYERQIWFCRLGANVGFEQDGRGAFFLRPVLFLKKFSRNTFWGVPLSTVCKGPPSYLFSFSFRKDMTSYALLSQLRLLDAKRLNYLSGKMTNKDFDVLKAKLRRLLA